MKIVRRGAAANHGPGTIEINNIKCKWDDTGESLVIKSDEAVRDFKTPARHFYRVRLDLSEISKVLKKLGEECLKIDSEDFAREIGPVVPALNRVIARASQVI